MARPRRRSGNLPAEATSFVGRRRELSEIRKRLTTARVVSLVGPGGVGKTRLAIRAADSLGRGFADGPWLVELADLHDPVLVTNAVVAALDLRDQTAAEPVEVLAAYLEDKQMLLVVDNCEHLLDAAAQLIAGIIRASPNVRVLTTSREPLQISGEYVVPVAPLELPEPTAAPLAQLRQNEAVMLFTERAAAASGMFELTEANGSAVVELCRRLDGLPLAIELAAVRTRTLTVEAIVTRLTDRFALLTGGRREALPRHQTLQATLDWSHDLLAPEEQTLLRRLCIFGGSFTAEDAGSVCSLDERATARTPDMLASLMDKSLIVREDFTQRAGYRLHDTMREYARVKLREADESDLVEERCLEHYRTRCLTSADQARYHLPEWLAWVDLEIDNIRAVLQRCVARGELARGLDIAASLDFFWITRGTTESIRWLDQLLAAGDASPETEVRACFVRGWLSLLGPEPADARPWVGRAVAAARGSGLRSELAQALSLAANAENACGDAAAARRLIEEAASLTRDLNDYRATIELLQAQAVHAVFARDTQEAKDLSTEGVRLSEAAGDVYYLESFRRNLASVAMLEGDLETAKAQTVVALRLARELDNRVAQYYSVSVLGWHAANSRQPGLGARLLGAAAILGVGAGADIVGPFEPFLRQAEASASSALGHEKYEAEFLRGKAISRESALRLALGEPDPAAPDRADDVNGGPLAARELDVARLIADGLSNKEIGARLFISQPTVATHVRNIMNKLGYNSRAQIAGWVASGSP